MAIIGSNSGRTPLSFAAQNGHNSTIKLLVGTGKVEYDLRDNSGRTPLSFAAENGHDSTIELLLGTGRVEYDSKDKI